MKQKGFAPILILILLALAVVGYFGYKNYWSKLQSFIIPTPIATADPTANWKTYTNTRYGYSLKYPSEWESLECDSKGHLFAIFGSDVASSCATDAPGDLIITVTDEVKDPLISVANEFKIVEKKTIKIGGETGEWVSVEKVKPSPGADSIIVAAAIHAGKTYTFNLSDVNEKENLNKILSTFKFTDSNISDIPQPISSFFAEINKNFNLNLVPIAENEFYSPTGMIAKKSWKLDFTDTSVGKSLTSFLLTKLSPNNEGGSIGGGGTDGYENGLIKCSHSYGYRGGGPTNWTDPFNYLTCTEK